MDAMAVVVRAIHLAFVLWMVWTPFKGGVDFLLMHAVTVPGLLVHWAVHSDGCVLTFLEKKMRGIEEDSKSFIWNIVNPIYKIDDCVLKRLVGWTTVALWAVTLWKLWKHYSSKKKSRNFRANSGEESEEKTLKETSSSVLG